MADAIRYGCPNCEGEASDGVSEGAPAERQPLTLEQIITATDEIGMEDGVFIRVARAIERAHGIGVAVGDARRAESERLHRMDALLDTKRAQSAYSDLLTFAAGACCPKQLGSAQVVDSKGKTVLPDTAPVSGVAPSDVDKTVRRWMSMIEAAYQCRDDIRDSSGNTPRSYELQFVADEMRAALGVPTSDGGQQ
jgi:hypothetical protein